MFVNHKMIYAILLLLICIACTVYAGSVGIQTGVVGDVAENDTLQDVFPVVSQSLPDGKISQCLVDGEFDGESVPKKGNTVILYHSTPCTVTWDIGAGLNYANAQLDQMKLVIVGPASAQFVGFNPCFSGQLLVSLNGIDFTPIPGTSITAAPSSTGVYMVINWTFNPGEIKNFRYLRLESAGYNGYACQVAEIDGWISGVAIRKSYDIVSSIACTDKTQITSMPPQLSQATPQPMQVEGLSLINGNIVYVATGQTIIDCSKVISLVGWQIVSTQTTSSSFIRTLRRSDGLEKKITITVDSNNLVEVSAELSSIQAVNYTSTDLEFRMSQMVFDGVTLGGVPSYLSRQACSVEIGITVPYLIFPLKSLGIELQMFMPDWYDCKGTMSIFESSSGLVKFKLYNAVRNRFEDTYNTGLSGDQWNPAASILVPGQKLNYKINIAAFKITPATLGQKDIESSSYTPLFWIDTGSSGQQALGAPTVTYRDKMQFIGFKLPEVQTAKPGHSIVDTVGTMTEAGIINRFTRAGVGVVLMMSDEYVDVSHGVSSGGLYDQSPSYLNTVLYNLSNRGIKPLWWFSPRGFLNQDWMGRPKDPMIDLHPDWFFSETHWNGVYQTVNSYNPAPNQWIMDKMTQDQANFTKLRGVAFDTFPFRGTRTGGDANTTITSEDQYWLGQFGSKAHSFGTDHIVLVNSTTPLYDDYMQYDYTVTENFPSMFVNEVSGGHAPFGKTFVSHLQWQQLHGWYVTLAHMYYNFGDYNQGLGWMHSIWLGWRASDVNSSFKPVDSQVIPLWYIMGKGKRIYSAEIATDVRQIEAEMPDGVPTVIVASVSPWPVSGPVSVIPQNLTDGHYWAEITIDTCQTQVRRRLFINTTTSAIQISDLPPFSISVLKFKKVIADSNSDYDNAILDFGKAAQGAYGWSYGVYNPTLQVFTEAASWQTTTKEWTSGLARIGQKNMVVPDNQNWVTRLWCSDVDGQVSISGNAALSSGSVDGCVLRILRNNNEIWSKHFGPGEEISYNLPYQNVLQDDKIMFCIDSGSSTVSDIVLLTAQIGVAVPQTCEQVWNAGDGMPEDFNSDCKVDFVDFAMLAAKWFISNNPE